MKGAGVQRGQDKALLVTAAARGQRRRHAVKPAEEGADIALFDIRHNAGVRAVGVDRPIDAYTHGVGWKFLPWRCHELGYAMAGRRSRAAVRGRRCSRLLLRRVRLTVTATGNA